MRVLLPMVAIAGRSNGIKSEFSELWPDVALFT